MAEEAYQDRTEEPTPKRQSEARERARWPAAGKSPTALVLITGVGMLSICGFFHGNQSAAGRWASLEGLRPGMVTSANMKLLLQNYGLIAGQLMAPLWLMLGIAAILG